VQAPEEKARGITIATAHGETLLMPLTYSGLILVVVFMKIKPDPGVCKAVRLTILSACCSGIPDR